MCAHTTKTGEKEEYKYWVAHERRKNRKSTSGMGVFEHIYRFRNTETSIFKK